MENSRFLLALSARNTGAPPVWFMRQAGRYLPEYRAYREKHSLRHLFFTPELAAEITCLPVDLLGVDAAILFADITLLALCFGLSLDFQEGPQISPLPASYPQIDPRECLSFVPQTIRLAKQKLSVPLIGFCGGPFTVASYLIGDLPTTLARMRADPPAFLRLLSHIASLSRIYLQMQLDAGANAIQIFESWGDALSPEEFQTFSLPFLRTMTQNLPAILFAKGPHAVPLSSLNTALSVDWHTSLPSLRRTLGPSTVLQGNLDPSLLFQPLPILRTAARSLLDAMRGDPAFIFNLGHGIQPKTPVDAVRCLIEEARKL